MIEVEVKAAEEPQALYWSMEPPRVIFMLDFVRYIERTQHTELIY